MTNTATGDARLDTGQRRPAASSAQSGQRGPPLPPRRACADSSSPPLFAPACPNCTSLLNSLAQVPLQVGGGREGQGG